jgi:hypothetical protein
MECTRVKVEGKSNPRNHASLFESVDVIGISESKCKAGYEVGLKGYYHHGIPMGKPCFEGKDTD